MEISYKEQVDRKRLPHSIAIIMDGNGRWAQKRGLERTMGHQAGAQTVHDIVEAAVNLGIDYLTLYTFSTENWNRPVDEVAALMALLLRNLEEELFMKKNARFRVIGDVCRLPKPVQDAVNFLLWQSAYTEFYFTDVYWPDFDEEELCKAICSYQKRQRRFGKTGEQVEEQNKNS